MLLSSKQEKSSNTYSTSDCHRQANAFLRWIRPMLPTTGDNEVGVIDSYQAQFQRNDQAE